MKKYEAPNFIKDKRARNVYGGWLTRQAARHFNRDRKKSLSITRAKYKEKIHEAVKDSRGVDAYTGEVLNWSQILTFNNNKAKRGGEKYMRKFALLPSVDHENPASKRIAFRICAWRTNDAKGYMTLKEFRQFCAKVLQHFRALEHKNNVVRKRGKTH